MKKSYQIADLNCWWNACAQGGFRQEVLFTFVKDTLDFLNIDSAFPHSGPEVQQMPDTAAAMEAV